jgi:hypothetical protein
MSRTVRLTVDAAETVRQLLADKGLVLDVLNAANAAAAVPWEQARTVLDRFHRLATIDPEFTHYVDQNASALTARHADFGIDLHDERCLFGALVFLDTFCSFAANACDAGEIDHHTHEALGRLVNGIGAVLSVLAPAEAR